MMSNPVAQGEHGLYPTPGSGTRRPGAAPVAAYCVWVDGELVPYDEESVQVLNPAMHRGPGVFEDIRCYQTERGPAIFRLRDHLQRFMEAVRLLGVRDLRYTIHDLQRAANVAVHANNFHACYIRPVLYFASGSGAPEDDYDPVVAVAAWVSPSLLAESRRKNGVRAQVIPFSNLDSEVQVNRGLRDVRYANSVLARQRARQERFDEAIIMDPGGYVAAATVENLFMVRGDVICTSPRSGIQAGVARHTLMTLAGEMGYRVVEAGLSRDQLFAADELFFCSTATEVIPVVALGSHQVGTGKPGPHTRALQDRYADTVRGRSEPAHGWLEYVMMEPLY